MTEPDAFWERIGTERFRSEADVEHRLVAPLLEALGYASADIEPKAAIVFAEGRRGRPHEADYIVHDGPVRSVDTSLIVVEAKKPGEKLDIARRQAESYAFASRAPFLLLTDGRELHVWQLQATRDSERVFACAVGDLAAHRGELEALVSRGAAVAHCRALRIKPLTAAAADHSAYVAAELDRLAGAGGVARTLQEAATGESLASTELLARHARGAVVSAPSGYGKSTLLQALHGSALASRREGGTGRLSFEVQLPDAVESDATILGYAHHRLAAHSPHVTDATMRDILRADGVLLLCDRFDRLADGAQRVVLAELRGLMRDFPRCQVVIFTRVPIAGELPLPDLALRELSCGERRAAAAWVEPALTDGDVAAMPDLPHGLAGHPLLLALSVRHRKRHGAYPHRLRDLFEGWMQALLEPSRRPASEHARLRSAITFVAQATAAGARPVGQVLDELRAHGAADEAFDELARCGALRVDAAVELQHEALADYLRAVALVSGQEAEALERVAALELPRASLFPVLLMAVADTPALHRALWTRLARLDIPTYLDALRYRADTSARVEAHPEQATRTFAGDMLDGVVEPLTGFFPALRREVLAELAGPGCERLGVDATLSPGHSELVYGFRAAADGEEAVRVGMPDDGRLRWLRLDRLGYRLDSGRLLGFRHLPEAIGKLAARRWLHGGVEWSNERLIGRLRYLEKERGLPVGDLAGLDEVEEALRPYRGAFVTPKHSSSDTTFGIAELFGEIAALRAAGRTRLDRWWERHGECDFADPHGPAAALLDEHRARAQRVYKELVEYSFPRVAAEFDLYRALPVRFELVVVSGAVRPVAVVHERWKPAAAWGEAGADVRFAHRAPPVDLWAHHETVTAALARLGRGGYGSVTAGRGPAPDLRGRDALGVRRPCKPLRRRH